MKKSILLVATMLVAGVSAHATSVTLTFTGIGDEQPIGAYYAADGIIFGADSLAIISDADGGTGNFTNVPAPGTTTIAFFLSGPGDVMDVAAGFTTGFSFYYAAANVGGSVAVYSGLDGTGTLISTIDLPVTGAYCGTMYAFSCFDEAGVAFSGTAESVVFGGSANQIGFADITLGAASVPPANATPEPSSLILLGTGMLGMAGAARRRFIK